MCCQQSSMNKIYFIYVMPTLFVLMAGFFIFIALKTLLERRPIIFSARWLFGFVCLAFLPMILNSFVFGFSLKHTNLITWMNPVMFAVLLVFFWFQMAGYIVIATSDTYFREALLSSAASLGYSTEETMSHLKIKETGEEMQVSIQGWMGTAQLKPSIRKSAYVVSKIAEGMNHYFKTTPGKMNYLVSYFYLIMGGFMIACAIGTFLLTKKC